MSDPEFARLEEVELRRAWSHEALDFTPWLARNLERLAEAVAIPLELEGTERAVGRYSADILARDSRSGEAVLIENQLEVSDHSHLGQILTYLTGLEARVVIWVALGFREEHLSAIRWLNSNTADAFSFFAVKLRVVRIADSPLAPLFEVVERPNNWNRQVEALAREAREVSPRADRRRRFWARYVELFPTSFADAMAGGGAARWRVVPGSNLVVSQWLATDSVGVFVRGGRGSDGPDVFDKLMPYADRIVSELGVELGERRWPLVQRLNVDTADEARWDEWARWLHDQAERYAVVLSRFLTSAASREASAS